MTIPFDPQKPAWVERVSTRINGRASDRLIFIFRAPGCTYAKRPGGGCTFCGFNSMTFGSHPWTTADLIAQANSVFQQSSALDGVGEIDLYNSGSFFADAEMPALVRAHVLDLLGNKAVARILVESRPEFITAERVGEACRRLPNTTLEVGIGLESADATIREKHIGKGFGLAEFERAAGILAQVGAALLVNVLLKPLGLPDDTAAVADVINSGRYIFALAQRLSLPTRIALQPVFVAPGTPLEREFLAGRYQTVSLWAVVDAAIALSALGETVVGLSDEGLEPRRSPSACGLCDDAIKAALSEFNRSGDPAPLRALNCCCKRKP